MEKDAKKKNRKDVDNITKIYETIKDKGFIQDLWLDVMSDIKEKPSYTRLKNMVEKVISEAVNNYATKPKDHEERLKTRTIFTDLSIMTYTIDTLISEILHKKLKDEFKSIIGNIVDEIKTKQMQTETEEQNNSVSMLEDIGELLCNGEEEDTKNQNKKPKTAACAASTLPNKRNSGSTSIHLATIQNSHSPASTAKHSIDFPNLNTVAFSIVETVSENTSRTNEASFFSTKDKLKRHVPNRISRKKCLEKVRKWRSKTSGSVSSEENSDVDIMNVSDEDSLSLDGNCSFRSLSSVHTSDLSSFEDDISISSEDEDGVKTKKRVSLKLANQLYADGALNKLYQACKKKSKPENLSKRSTPAKISLDSPNKRLSARTRKPNSKYSSDDVICPVKQLLSQTDSYLSNKAEFNSTVEYSGSNGKAESLVREENNEKRGRPRKATRFDIRRVNQIIASRASRSKASTEEMSKTKKSAQDHSNLLNDVQSGKQSKKGRPPRNKNSETDKLVPNDEQSKSTESTNKKDLKVNVHVTVLRPICSEITEVKKKRGRPTKVDLEKKSTDDERINTRTASNLKKGMNQQTSLGVQEAADSENSEPEYKRRKGRPPNDNSVNKINDATFKHSAESFSILEESLCLKDQKISQQSTPPKSSTKSYQTSDLYKPRSDFRVSFNSRGSKALTLFSN